MRATIRVLLIVCALAAFACSSTAPTTPTSAPTASIARVDIGVLGAAPALVRVGDTLQMFARATDVNGSATDVTNLASWSSADPEKATVVAGVVVGRVPGVVKVSATFSGASGGLDTTVAVMACATSTLSPISRVFAAKALVPCSDDDGQYGEHVAVTASQSTCAWTVASDVPWLGMDCYARLQTFTPFRPGSGAFDYLPQWNNTTSSRTGHLTVTFSDGSRLIHTVTQEAPACSYQVSPTSVSLPKAGGSGSFDLTVSPASCQWTLDSLELFDGVVTVSPSSGTGSRRIDYTARTNPNTFTRTYNLPFADAAKINPAGVFTIRLAGQ